MLELERLPKWLTQGQARKVISLNCRTIQISHAEDNADPRNGRLPALRCGDWLGPLLSVFIMIVILGCGGEATDKNGISTLLLQLLFLHARAICAQRPIETTLANWIRGQHPSEPVLP